MSGPTETPNLAAAVAIIGMSCRFPDASDPAQLWSNLCAGHESVRVLTDDELRAAGADPAHRSLPSYVSRGVVLEDVDRFDAAFFGFSPRDAEILDPQQRIFLECAWHALEDAGYDPARYEALIGVFGGVDFPAYLFHLLNSPEIMAAAGAAAVMLANEKDQLTPRVAYKLNLKGPAVTVQTACSSSLVAVCQACQSLLCYQCELALAGGSSIALNQGAGYFWDEGELRSPDGRCRAFDAAAQGIASGSGSGVVVLKRYEEALADGDNVYAVIRGFGINNDGSAKIGFTAPSVEGQAEAIRTALTMAEVDPRTIGYVETHGTGTPLGDPIEVAALIEAYREHERRRFCGLGSIKTNMGHLGAAAGVAGLIKTVLALRHRMLPPSLNFRQPNPQIDFDNSPFFVVDRLQPWQNGSAPLRAGVSSFGMGGTNAHLVLEEGPSIPSSQCRRRWQLLPLAARTQSALERMTANLESFLRSRPEVDRADVAYTLQVGRQAFAYRRVLLVETGDVAGERDDPRRSISGAAAADPAVGFHFPGETAPPIEVVAELYETEPVFRQQVDECGVKLGKLGVDLRDPLGRPRSPAAGFVVEYALARLWMSWGVEPRALTGEGVGEIVAGCLAGVFSLDDALGMVVAPGPRAPLRSPTGAALLDGSATVLLRMGRARSPATLARPPGDGGRPLELASLPHPQDHEPASLSLMRALGALWAHGVEVGWQGLHQGEKRRRVPLPTYPFERRRYWVSRPVSGIATFPAPAALPGSAPVPAPTPAAPAPARKKDVADWFSVPVWKPISIPQAAPPSPPGSWLVFCGADSRARDLVMALEARGERVRTVCAAPSGPHGVRVDHVLDFMQPAEYRRLLRELRARGDLPRKIVHWWDGPEPEPEPEPETEPGGSADPVIGAARGLFSLLYLAQAIADAFDEQPLELSVVTAGRARISPRDRIDPAQAMRAGVCPVIAKEMPAVRARAIDLPAEGAGDEEAQALLAALVTELACEPSQPIVALRHSGRWRLDYEPAPHLDPAAAVRRLRRRGVYLVTGGLGGIGLELARHLAEKVQARLVLVGRSPLPDRARWQEWLETHPPDDPVSSKLRRLQAIEAAAAEVLVVAADVTDPAAMAALAERVRQKFGAVDGIVHAAGIAGHGMIALKTTEQAADVLAAKVRGVETVAKAFVGAKLDFFVLCSSLSALHGGFGQFDYCAANCYLDAFAERYRDQGVVSVNWDAWNEVGMATARDVPAELEEMHRRNLEDAITPAEGRLALDFILSGTVCQLVVSPTDLAAQLRQAVQPAHLADLDLPEAAARSHPRPPLATPYVAPRNETEEKIAEIWSELLGIEPVGIHDSFLEFGGHSLLGIRLSAQLRQTLGVHVSVAMLFETPTIAGLTQRLSLETISETRAFDRLLPLRERGSLPPLFCVHPVTGLSWSYAGLVRELDGERPIYGLQAAGIATAAPLAPDVETFAEDYLDAIRTVQPSGPYHLLGWSFGGLVAYTMACRLRRQGEEVALLALLDSYPHGEASAAPEPTAEEIRHWKAELLCRVLAIDRQELGPDPCEVATVLEAAHRQGVVATFSEDHADRLLELTRHNDLLYPGFQPGRLDGDLLFFIATEGKEDAPGAPKLSPEAWQPYVTGRIEVHAIPCGHHDMTQPAAISTIGRRLEQYLRARKPRAEESAAAGGSWQLLRLSGLSAAAREAETARLAAELRAHPGRSLAEVASTLGTGRRLPYRRTLVCRGIDDAMAALESPEGRALDSFEERDERAVTFLCSGLGGHYPGMGRGLYEHEPLFRAEVDRCCEVLEPILGLDLRQPLFQSVPAREPETAGLDLRRLLGRGAPPESVSTPLDETHLAQPAVLVIEIALARLLRSWGIVPKALIGYSLGEYTAAYLAGVWSLEDVLTLVAERARLIATLPAGAMAAVPLSESEVLPLLGDGLALAAANAPEVSVVAGPEEAMGRFEAEMKAAGRPCQRLRTRHAFHSPMMEPIAAAFAERLRRVSLRSPRIPYLSNLTGTWIRPEEAVDPDYWVRHLCQTVRFAEGLGVLLADPEAVLLEIGPGQALATAARQHPQRPAGKVVVAALRDERELHPDQAFLLHALGQLWLAGAPLDRAGLALAA